MKKIQGMNKQKTDEEEFVKKTFENFILSSGDTISKNDRLFESTAYLENATKDVNSEEFINIVKTKMLNKKDIFFNQ